MKKTCRYIQLLAGALAVLLCTACRSGEHDDIDTEPATLSIYVYAPGMQASTRSGGVRASDAENKITKLQLWAFVHKASASDPDKLIGYLDLTGEQLANLNSDLHSEVYRMTIDDKDFASSPKNVDIYVVANQHTESCGTVVGENFNTALLNNVRFSYDYFLRSDLNKYNANYGLPMADSVSNRKVEGQNAVLHVSGANLTLVRAVSKVRFVFSRSSFKSPVDIERIELDSCIMPTETYLFLNGSNYRSTTEDIKYAMPLIEGLGTIKDNENPVAYKYNGGDLLDYEDLINQGISKGELTADSVYLRETDKPLSGTIYYTVGDDATERTARFTMSDDGRFYRNRTWIVYSYYNAASLEVETVQVNDWKEGSALSDSIYNW